MKFLWKARNLIWLVLPLLLWWVLRDAPITDIRNILEKLNPIQLTGLAALNLLITALFGSRWWLILRAQGYRVPYLSLASYRLAGFSISYFTPGTQFGGEPLQVYLLSARHQIPAAAALASVTLDKLFELLANFTFLAIGVSIILNSSLLAGTAGFYAMIWISGLLLLPLIYLLTLWASRFPLTWLASRLPARLLRHPVWSKAPALIASTERQISSLIKNQPLTILWIVFMSGVIWLLAIGEYWLSLTFLGAHLSLPQAISALTAARLAFLTPLPGGIGTLEASQIMAMQALGFSAALGISLSLLIRGRDLSLGIIGLGLGTVLTHTHSIKPHSPEASTPEPLPSQSGD